jgi:hypothetical protein
VPPLARRRPAAGLRRAVPSRRSPRARVEGTGPRDLKGSGGHGLNGMPVDERDWPPRTPAAPRGLTAMGGMAKSSWIGTGCEPARSLVVHPAAKWLRAPESSLHAKARPASYLRRPRENRLPREDRRRSASGSRRFRRQTARGVEPLSEASHQAPGHMGRGGCRGANPGYSFSDRMTQPPPEQARPLRTSLRFGGGRPNERGARRTGRGHPITLESNRSVLTSALPELRSMRCDPR